VSPSRAVATVAALLIVAGGCDNVRVSTGNCRDDLDVAIDAGLADRWMGKRDLSAAEREEFAEQLEEIKGRMRTAGTCE
jgi:hypothetical protein